MAEKNIWIFHHYATPPTLNGLTRPYYFGRHLKQAGYKVTVFSASYLHYANTNLIRDHRSYIENHDTEIPYVYVRTPSYHNSGIKRIRNMLAFYKRLFSVTKAFLNDHPKPDVIIASSPHPLTMIAGIKIAKKLGIPCICEIRDFWPEVFFTGGKLKENGPLGKALIGGEHWIYKRADAIIFLKEGDHTYITDHGWDTTQGGAIDMNKCYYINNGVDIEQFNRSIRENPVNDEDLTNGKFRVVYTGAIRPVNNVGRLLDAAALLKGYDDIQFLLYGDGNQMETLQQRIDAEGLHNVTLKGYIDKKYIPYVLSQSTLPVLNYSQSMYNWSRGNSSNKLFEYMAAGKPIISTVQLGYNPLDKYQCGLSLEQDTPEKLAEAIKQIYEMPEEVYQQMGANAKAGAIDFDYTTLSAKLMNVVEEVCAGKTT